MIEDPAHRDPGRGTRDQVPGPDGGLSPMVRQKSDSDLASYHASGQISDQRIQDRYESNGAN